MRASSELRFIDADGRDVGAPLEWERYTLVLPIDPADWERAQLSVQGRPADVSLSHIGGAPAVIARWPRRNAGYWRCRLRVGGTDIPLASVLVRPGKLDAPAFEAMLRDIDERLLISILYALEQGGAFAGERRRPPAPATLGEELQRLHRAVLGDETGGGLAAALGRIARDPHRHLIHEHLWTRAESARAPVAHRLALAYAAPVNAGVGGEGGARRPERVWDGRVRHTVDIYENRLIKAFGCEIDRRLRRIRNRRGALGERLQAIEEAFRPAWRAATFLEEAGPLRGAPRAASMVLRNRPDYRLAYRRWIEYRRQATLSIDLSEREAPIENTPYLYEVWATLLALDALLAEGAAQGWQVERQSLFRHRAGWYADLEWDGRVLVSLGRGEAEQVRARAQPSFSPGGRPLRSISKTQRPDLVIEIDRPDGPPRLLVIDPKYKLIADLARQANVELDTEAGAPNEDADSGDLAAGRPVKADIDKMHAYRDAIRTIEGAPVVEWAAILYPGSGIENYDDQVAALGARPGHTSTAKAHLREVFARYLE